MTHEERKAMNARGPALRQNHLVAVLAAAAAVWAGSAAACGDSGSSTTPAATPTAAATGVEPYVDAVCTAARTMFVTYQKDFTSNSASLVGMDPTDAYMKIAKGPYGVLIADLEKIVPPADVKTGHEAMIRQAKDLLAALNAGDRTKVLALKGTPDTGTWKQVLEVPQDLKTRLGTVAKTRQPCLALEQAGGGNPFQ
jgi:hypothetical protein